MIVVAVAYYSLKEMTRRKLLYFIVGGGAVLVLALGILVTLIRANAPVGAVPDQDFSGFVLIQLSGVVSIFAWVASIAIAVTLINHDLESGSVVSIFSKPVSRLSYALGKVLAAAAMLLAVVVVLGIGTQVIVLTNGGGHEWPLLKTFLLIAANQLTQMLVILVLSVVMNNIVAAIIGIVIIQVGKFVAAAHSILHTFIDQGATGSNIRAISTVFDVVFWIVPRELQSDLVRDVYLNAQATRDAVGLGTIYVSGPLDVAYWLAWVALLFFLLIWVLRRREV
ncbi:MAG: hypothetical protein WAT58_01195 [Candidatus Dormiibacterota bacterium]